MWFHIRSRDMCSFRATMRTRICVCIIKWYSYVLHNKYSNMYSTYTIKWCHTIQNIDTSIYHLSANLDPSIYSTNDTNDDHCRRSIDCDTLYRNLLRMARVLCSVDDHWCEQLLVADDQWRRENNAIYDHCRSTFTRSTKWTLVRQIASVWIGLSWQLTFHFSQRMANVSFISNGRSSTRSRRRLLSRYVCTHTLIIYFVKVTYSTKVNGVVKTNLMNIVDVSMRYLRQTMRRVASSLPAITTSAFIMRTFTYTLDNTHRLVSISVWIVAHISVMSMTFLTEQIIVLQNNAFTCRMVRRSFRSTSRWSNTYKWYRLYSHHIDGITRRSLSTVWRCWNATRYNCENIMHEYIDWMQSTTTDHYATLSTLSVGMCNWSDNVLFFSDSDSECIGDDDDDLMPVHLRNKQFRETWDCLSLNATLRLLDRTHPRAVFDGHTHFGCRTWWREPYAFWEYTVSSFSWRNIDQPTFLLMSASINDLAVSKCRLPSERMIIRIYTISSIMLIVVCLLMMCVRTSRGAMMMRRWRQRYYYIRWVEHDVCLCQYSLINCNVIINTYMLCTYFKWLKQQTTIKTNRHFGRRY